MECEVAIVQPVAGRPKIIQVTATENINTIVICNSESILECKYIPILNEHAIAIAFPLSRYPSVEVEVVNDLPMHLRKLAQKQSQNSNQIIFKTNKLDRF